MNKIYRKFYRDVYIFVVCRVHIFDQKRFIFLVYVVGDIFLVTVASVVGDKIII